MPRLNASQSTRIFQWMNRPELMIDQLPPVLNAWFTVLNVSGGLRIRSFVMRVINDLSVPQDFEWRGNLDGIDILSGQTVLSPAAQYGYVEYRYGEEFGLILSPAVHAFTEETESDLFTCHNLNLEMRCHSALGTNPELIIVIHYQTWEQV